MNSRFYVVELSDEHESLHLVNFDQVTDFSQHYGNLYITVDGNKHDCFQFLPGQWTRWWIEEDTES